MSRKISVEDLARYVSAAHELAHLIADAIKNEECEAKQDLVLALNEFATAADNIADITASLQSDKFRLN